MLEWIITNLSTILICAILGVLLFLAGQYIYRRRKSGGCAFCPGCSDHSCCHCDKMNR